jgi:hypothetical protein
MSDLKEICPICNSAKNVRPIIYGLPGPDFDFKKYASGGCVVSGSDPMFVCGSCGLEFGER